MDLLLDDSDLVDQNGDFLFENLDNLLLVLVQWSWSWLEWLAWFNVNDISSDGGNLLLENMNLLNQLVNSLVNENRGFWFWLWIQMVVMDQSDWSLFDDNQFVENLLDVLSDDGDLLSDDSDLLVEDSDLLDDLWSLSSWGSWETGNQLVDLVSDDGDLLNQLSDNDDLLGDLLLVDDNLVGSLLLVETSEGWSRKSSDLLVNFFNVFVAFVGSDSERSTLWSWGSVTGFDGTEGSFTAFLKFLFLSFKFLEFSLLSLGVSTGVNWLQVLWSVDDEV